MAFVGDGVSDRFGARYADVTFAKDELAEHCRRASIPFLAYEDFDDVRTSLEGLDAARRTARRGAVSRVARTGLTRERWPRDSNPRGSHPPYTLSRRVPSAARADHRDESTEATSPTDQAVCVATNAAYLAWPVRREVEAVGREPGRVVAAEEEPVDEHGVRPPLGHTRQAARSGTSDTTEGS